MTTEIQAGADRRDAESRSMDEVEQGYGSKVLLLTVVVLILMAAVTLWWPRA